MLEIIMPSFFRPCIDLHKGLVKQIVGTTLDPNEWVLDGDRRAMTSPICSNVICNFTSSCPASYFARKFQHDGLRGGHVIMLGQGLENINAAKEALSAYPQGLHIGGGMRLENIESWLEAGAGKVIMTSWLFDDHAELSENRLRQVSELIGRQHFVADLSCRPINPSTHLQPSSCDNESNVSFQNSSHDHLSLLIE